MPAVVSLATALVDLYGSCDSVRPNIGEYSCFIGEEFDFEVSFVETALFKVCIQFLKTARKRKMVVSVFL